MGNKRKGNILVKFLGNRNTVTILGIVACIATLIIGYNMRVYSEIRPTKIPFAKETIEARTLITEEMVGQLRISGDYLASATNVVKVFEEVVNKYATYKSNIPKGSLFYREMLKSPEEMPDYAFANIPDGHTIFSLNVSEDATYGGQIRTGQYIDLYARLQDNTDESGRIIFANLIKSIRVLGVKDKSGANIIEGSGGKPAELLFAVPEHIYLLLSRATNINISIEIIPVIRNQNYTIRGEETKVPLSELEKIINEHVKELGNGE